MPKVPDKPRRARHKPFLSSRARLLVLVALLVAVPAAVASYALWGRPISFIAHDEQQRVLYEVPENIPVSRLVEDLHERKLIAFPNVLRAVLRLTGWETRVRAGFYYLQPRNSVMEIARKLTSGEMATRTIIVTEGKTTWETYETLKRHFPKLDSLVFDSLASSPEFAHSLGVEADGLEGYLYPDTYVVPWSLRERDILRIMVARFHEVLAELPVEGNAFVEQYGIHGLVTLASIVEKEAAVRREQPLIAGVFHNRLRQRWSLGADPTVRYALRKLTGPLTTADLNIDSPYNTRRYRGLPPGPVASPSRSALLATLEPEQTRKMFFVAKDDGSREHFFSVTYAEHNRYRRMAAENRAAMRRQIAQRAAAAAEVEMAEAPADRTAPEASGSPTAPGSDPRITPPRDRAGKD